MAKDDRFKHKRTSVSGKVPKPEDLVVSQLAVNFPDKKLYTKDAKGNVINLSGDEPIIVVDRIVEDANTSFSVNDKAKYLVQKANVSAFTGLSQQLSDALARSIHAQQVVTFTVTGSPNKDGSFTLLGRTVSYTNGQVPANLAGVIATELTFLQVGSDSLLKANSVTRNGAVVEMTYRMFQEYDKIPEIDKDGFKVTSAITTVGGNGDHLWGVIKSDGSQWLVDEVAENINFSVVAERSAPQRLVHVADPTLRQILPEIQLDWIKAGEYPTKASPKTVTTSKQVHVTPSVVEDMIEGVYERDGFAALDPRRTPSLSSSDYDEGKTFFVVRDGSVSLDGTSVDLKATDSLIWYGNIWTTHPREDHPQQHRHVVDQVSHGFSTGDVVYFQQSTTSYKKAKADLADTSGIVAVVEKVNDNQFYAVFSGIIDQIPNLTIGQTYYLSQTTEGAFTASAPSSGIVKFVFQCIENGKILILPIIAYDAGSSSGGSSSYTRQQLIDTVTQNGTAGADRYLSGDGTFKAVGNLAQLFSSVETAGTLQGGIPTDYPAVGSNITITNTLSGQMIRASGILPSASFNLILNDQAFDANKVSMIINQSEQTMTVKTATKDFAIPQRDRANLLKEFTVGANEFIVLVANHSDRWYVMHSGYHSEIDDNASNTTTDATYSVQKILQSISNLIDDASTASSDKTWSINEIKRNATFQHRITAGSRGDIDSGRDDSITINRNISGKLIELLGVFNNSGYDVTLGTNTWASGVTMFVNRSDKRQATLRSTKGFLRWVNGQSVSTDRVEVQAGRMVIITRDVANDKWIVMESGDEKWLDDSAVSGTDLTYSIDKIKSLLSAQKGQLDRDIDALIDNAALTGTTVTWSVDKIKNELKTVSDSFANLIDDSSPLTNKVWSSKKVDDTFIQRRDFRLVEQSMMGSNVPVHLDAFYAAGIERVKSSDIVSGRNASKWRGRDIYASWMELTSKVKVSSHNASRDGFYALEFDGANTYGHLKRGSTNVNGADVFPQDTDVTIIAVFRPRALPSGVQEYDVQHIPSIIHNFTNITLGLYQSGITFNIKDTNSNNHQVSITLNSQDLDKDYIVMAHISPDGEMNLKLRGDGQYDVGDFLDISGRFAGGYDGASHWVELGQSQSGNNHLDSDIMEIVVMNGGNPWLDRDNYFNYFADKWGVDI